MKFFLDENFPRPALTQLQAAGHSAVHALEIFPPGTADDALFAHAQQKHAVFVTTDRDCFHTVPLTFAHDPGAMVERAGWSRQPGKQDQVARGLYFFSSP